MKNEKSYAELMKSYAMNRKNGEKDYILSLYVEMILNEAILLSEKEKLLKEIDLALDRRDKHSFYALSEQLIDLEKRFGS